MIFFDYDLNMALVLNQGGEEILNEKHWIVLSDSWIYGLIGKKRRDRPQILSFPSNIISLKDVNPTRK